MQIESRPFSTFPRRCPFTLLMLAVLVVAGVYGRTHVGLLDPDVQQRVGFSVRMLLEGQLHRAMTSIFFTGGGWQFYASLVMFAGAVGWIELTHGTRLAVLTFFGVHFATLILLSAGIAWPLVLMGTHRGGLLFDARDVGPSAGYYGCLGLAVAGLSARTRNVVSMAILVVLMLRVILSTIQLPEQGRMMSADLAHLAAFPLGLLLSRIFELPRWNRRPLTSQRGG